MKGIGRANGAYSIQNCNSKYTVIWDISRDFKFYAFRTILFSYFQFYENTWEKILLTITYTSFDNNSEPF